MGGYDLGMLEVNEAADQIEKSADKDAIVIFGASVKEELQDEIIITVIATGFEDRGTDRIVGNRDIIRPGSADENKPEEQSAEPDVEDEDGAGPETKAILKSIRRTSRFLPSLTGPTKELLKMKCGREAGKPPASVLKFPASTGREFSAINTPYAEVI